MLFFSKLTGGEIADEDFLHACRVWEEFGMKNMGEFHDLYLKTDVLLLADVFENFRKLCLKNYELDPSWYLTAAAFAWDAMLKMTGVGLEILSEEKSKKFNLFERQIRGGVSSTFHRYGRGNNKFMKEFDEKKPSKFVVYFDANSLYATAMLEPSQLMNLNGCRRKSC